MALTPLKLGDVQQTIPIVDADGRPIGFFVRLLNDNSKNIKNAYQAIVDNIEATTAAQSAADAAQDAAIDALTNAAAAQGAADAAQIDATAAQGTAAAAAAAAAAAGGVASTAVQQNVGPAWSPPSGTESRSSFASYTAAVISNPPTQAEVQAVADALQAVSRALKAAVDDLITNGALT